MEGWKDMGTDTLVQLTLFDNDYLESGSNEEKLKCKKCGEFKSRSRFKKGYKWKGMIERVCLSCTRNKEADLRRLKKLYPYPKEDHKCPICTRTREDIKKEGEHGGLKNNREVFVYWDLKAEPNENGNQWRKAINPLKVMIEKPYFRAILNTIGEVENE